MKVTEDATGAGGGVKVCTTGAGAAAAIEVFEALAGPEKPNETFAVFDDDDLSLGCFELSPLYFQKEILKDAQVTATMKS